MTTLSADQCLEIELNVVIQFLAPMVGCFARIDLKQK